MQTEQLTLPPPEEFVVGPLRVNVDRRSAIVGDSSLTLTPVEFDLLASLARARGRVKSRDALLEEIRNRNYEVFDRSIDVHISGLRKKLGDDAKNPRFIRTMRSAGYMLVDSFST
jgi:DNA-binding response OmpR family regulator